MASEYDQFEKVFACGSDEEKLAILKSMQEQIVGGEPAGFFNLAKELVADRNHNVRWQAIIVIGSYIPTERRNEEVWNVILQFCGMDDDMQNALATVLLEHLLEYDFDHTFDRIKTAIPERTAPLLDLVRRCWQFGQPEAKWHQLQQLVKNYT